MLTMEQTVRAAFLSGKGATAEEIGAEIGFDNLDTLRRTLAMFAANPSRKDFGARPMSVMLTKKQRSVLERAAAARGLVGPFKAEPLVERLMRVLTSDAGLVDNVLDDGVKSI